MVDKGSVLRKNGASPHRKPHALFLLFVFGSEDVARKCEVVSNKDS